MAERRYTTAHGGSNQGLSTIGLGPPNLASVLHQLNPEELLSDDWRRMNGQQKESRSQALGRAVADLGEGMQISFGWGKTW